MSPQRPAKTCPARLPNAEYFWLCAKCASTMTLVLRPRTGTVVVTLNDLGEKMRPVVAGRGSACG